ncbi:MAG: hypothetical protein ABJM29_13920 [Rhizobiaceae bacterium]
MTYQTSNLADIRLFEQALSKDLHQRLLKAVVAIGDEKPGGKSSYATTFWYPNSQTPSNVAEEVIVALREMVQPPADCIGAEWWLGRLPYGKKLGMHFDRDLTLSRKAGKEVFPVLGSVLYLNDYPSAPTVLTDQVPGPDGKSKMPPKAHLTTAVAAESNNYVVFPGNRLHGVIPDLSKAHEGLKAGEKTPEKRLTFLVNFWHCRPSEPICRDYDGSVYRALRDRVSRAAA